MDAEKPIPILISTSNPGILLRQLTPEDAEPPAPTEPELEDGDDQDEPEEECGSVIGCENASLGESVRIAGTPFRLHYQSDRTEGFRAGRRVDHRVRTPSAFRSWSGPSQKWRALRPPAPSPAKAGTK